MRYSEVAEHKIVEIRAEHDVDRFDISVRETMTVHYSHTVFKSFL